MKGVKIGTKITSFNLLILVLFYIISLISLWTLLSISSNYRLKNYREELFTERKYSLKNIVSVGYNLIQEAYNSQKNQSRHKTNDEEAKKKILQDIKKIRYDEDAGYLWINDTSKPYPVMIMDPVMPELNDKVLSDSKYNTMGKEKRNLFAAAVETGEKNGSGFIEYLWPKPGADNAMKDQPKLSFVMLFKPWGWIIGSGIYTDDLETKVNQEKEQSDKEMTGLFFTITIILAVICILILPFIFLFTRRLIKPLKETIRSLKEISEGKGDLTKRIVLTRNDEMGDLAKSFNELISSLNEDLIQVGNITNTVKDTSETSKDLMDRSIKPNLDIIKETIQKLDTQSESSTSGIEELTATLEEVVRNIESIMNIMVKQASAVEEGASSIEEMVRNIENTTEMSNKTKDISQNLNSVSIEGSTAVKASVQSIREVAEYSQQILKLLGLISNIAKQTNLLAMNAAIEAAHAGEAGKGFAIVADEIRRLSEDTNKNARDIGDVVSTIVGRIDDSVRLAEKAGVGLDMITAYSGQNVQIISQLSVAIAEQNNGAKEILKSTQELVKITEEVKLSMIEQKDATYDFSGALNDLRNMSIDNKESTKKHIEAMNHLIKTIEQIKGNILDNADKTRALKQYLEKYVLQEKTSDKRNEEKTGLKLVE